jgi:hypothetical protein
MIKDYQFVVKDDYVDRWLLCKGTTATCLDWNTEVVTMRIDTPAGNSDVVPGEEVSVASLDFWKLWGEAPPPMPSPSLDGDDRGKLLYRHPADPGPGWR